MTAPLAGRAVVVTGASSGIGRVLARQLVGRGARVVAAARSGDKLRALAEEIGPMLVPVAADVTDEESVSRLAAAARERAGPIDVVVNNAGVGFVAPFLFAEPARWREVIDTNLIGPLLVARAFLPSMLEAGRGLLVNVGSHGASGWPYVTLYAASKAALQTATRSLDGEYAPRGVRAVLVEVGSTVDTDFSTGTEAEHMAAAIQAWTAAGIAWDEDLTTAEQSAGKILAAVERGLCGTME